METNGQERAKRGKGNGSLKFSLATWGIFVLLVAFLGHSKGVGPIEIHIIVQAKGGMHPISLGMLKPDASV